MTQMLSKMSLEDRNDADTDREVLRVLNAPNKPLKRRLSFSMLSENHKNSSAVADKRTTKYLGLACTVPGPAPSVLAEDCENEDHYCLVNDQISSIGRRSPGPPTNLLNTNEPQLSLTPTVDDLLRHAISFDSDSPTYLRPPGKQCRGDSYEYPADIDSITSETRRTLNLDPDCSRNDCNHIDLGRAHADPKQHIDSSASRAQAHDFLSPLIIKSDHHICSGLIHRAKRVRLQSVQESVKQFDIIKQELLTREYQQQCRKDNMHHHAKANAGRYFKCATIDRMIDGRDIYFDERTRTSQPVGLGGMEEDQDFEGFVNAANVVCAQNLG